MGNLPCNLALLFFSLPFPDVHGTNQVPVKVVTLKKVVLEGLVDTWQIDMTKNLQGQVVKDWTITDL